MSVIGIVTDVATGIGIGIAIGAGTGITARMNQLLLQDEYLIAENRILRSHITKTNRMGCSFQYPVLYDRTMNLE